MMRLNSQNGHVIVFDLRICFNPVGYPLIQIITYSVPGKGVLPTPRSRHFRETGIHLK